MCRRSCCCDLWKYILCWCFYDNDDDHFDVHAILDWNYDVEKYGSADV